MSVTALVEKATNEFIQDGRFEDPSLYDRLPMPRTPDPLRERYSGNLAAPFVAKSASETQAAITAAVVARAQTTSRQKDMLATIAWGLRARNVATWNSLTRAQKRAAVLAEADTWRDVRVFIETNF